MIAQFNYVADWIRGHSPFIMYLVAYTAVIVILTAEHMRKREKPKELDSAQIIREMSQRKCGCTWWRTCKPCGERMTRVREDVI